MMFLYKNDLQNMSTPCLILKPEYVRKNGKEVKEYPSINTAIDDSSNIFFCSFKTYGGTEKVMDQIYTIEDTANIVCYYNPKIKSNCRIVRLEDNAIFDVINEPEDIDMRHQYMKFKIKRTKGSV